MVNKSEMCLGCGTTSQVYKFFCVNCLNKRNYTEEQRYEFDCSVVYFEKIEESCRDYEYEEEQEEYE